MRGRGVLAGDNCEITSIGLNKMEFRHGGQPKKTSKMCVNEQSVELLEMHQIRKA